MKGERKLGGKKTLWMDTGTSGHGFLGFGTKMDLLYVHSIN